MTRSSFARTRSRKVAHVKPRSNTLQLAAIQMAAGPHVATNLAEARRLVEIAAVSGAGLVVLPEFFSIMGMREGDVVATAEEDGHGVVQDFLAGIAARNKVWLVGTVPLHADDPSKVRNSCLVYDDGGSRVARYDKIHLFGLDMGSERYREADTIEAGDRVVVVDTPFGRMGLAVCYDLRFPELFRAMGDVDLIVVPSAFTETTGKAHWELLVRARAVENLAYVVAAGQGGYHLNGRETHGDSMIVDPWGVVADRLPRGSGVVLADMDRAYQASLRGSLPALRHRIIHQC